MNTYEYKLPARLFNLRIRARNAHMSIRTKMFLIKLDINFGFNLNEIFSCRCASIHINFKIYILHIPSASIFRHYTLYCSIINNGIQRE